MRQPGVTKRDGYPDRAQSRRAAAAAAASQVVVMLNEGRRRAAKALLLAGRQGDRCRGVGKGGVGQIHGSGQTSRLSLAGKDTNADCWTPTFTDRACRNDRLNRKPEVRGRER